MIDELDVVALIHPMTTLSENEEGTVRLEEGERGTVVMVYGDHAAYEVEFMEGGDSPDTKALVTIPASNLRLVWKSPANAAFAAN